MICKVRLIKESLSKLSMLCKGFELLNACVFIILVILIIIKPALAAGDNIWGAFDYTANSCATPSSMSFKQGGLSDSPACHWESSDPTDRSKVLWGAGQKWSPTAGAAGRGGAVGGFYVPYTGVYRMRAHFCPSNSRSVCTIAKSTQTMDTVDSLNISSAEAINARKRNFGGYSGQLSVDSNACYTLVDTQGFEWTGGGGFMCKDGGTLPSTPSTCYLNQSMDLSVEMGSLERSKISTVPASGTAGNIKKTIPVLCTRDAGVTVETTFQFTPLTVNGNEVVSTSTSNLGVAIFYNGTLVGPASTPVTETFEAGYAYRELEFQAIRNPDIAPKDILTGTFTASAVMVMTEQ